MASPYLDRHHWTTILLILTFLSEIPIFLSQLGHAPGVASIDEFSILDYDRNSEFVSFHGDYSPPSPPPPTPPPHSPSLTCDELKGVGSLNTTCELGNSLNFTGHVYVEGTGDFYVLPGVTLNCPVSGCSITVNVTGDFKLGLDSKIVSGTVYIVAGNVSLVNGSMINVTALAGFPPDHTSGTPKDAQGGGGGHGGRGASCVMDNKKLPEDVWGGDAYSWESLEAPFTYGSAGGTTNKDEDYGGRGGGRIWIQVQRWLEARGSLLADGGDGGVKGGGGSGGSIFVYSHKM